MVFSGIDTVAVSPPPFETITGAIVHRIDGQRDGRDVVSAAPSLAVKVKLSVPLKSAFGV